MRSAGVHRDLAGPNIAKGEFVSSAVLYANPEGDSLEDVVDVDQYPVGGIGGVDCKSWRDAVGAATTALAAHGCATLSGFLNPAGLAQARHEIEAMESKATVRSETSSVYARSEAEVDLVPEDPRSVQLSRRIGHLTRDQIAPDTVLARLYAAPGVKRFVAECVGETRIFEYADPLAGLVVTVVPPGGELHWHYDTNEFVVTLMVTEPDEGGLFEYCPWLRSPGDENLDGLDRVLRSDAPDAARTLLMRPGDLQIFMGRYSLHRVTQVRGKKTRCVGVLGYANRPGVIGPVDRTRSVYGRVTEAHLLAAEFAPPAGDGLIL